MSRYQSLQSLQLVMLLLPCASLAFLEHQIPGISPQSLQARSQVAKWKRTVGILTPAKRPDGVYEYENGKGFGRGRGVAAMGPGDFSGDNMAGRGDLRNGMDAERNAQIAALKRAFYTGKSEEGSTPEAESLQGVSLLGVLRDAPLCRWEMVMLPGYNHVLNVWQPMYTHMFESLLAGKQPWHYVHLQTPGGTKNLMNPLYSLTKPDSKTPRVGVLMRVVSAERREDSRLTCVVQGLTRVRILEETQREPYARATVQLLPDDECTRECYSLAEHVRWKGQGREAERDWWVHTVAHAAAVASEMAWLEYDTLPVALTNGGVSQFSPFSSVEGLEAAVASRLRAQQKVVVEEAADLAAAVQARSAYVSVVGAPVLSTMDLALAGVLGGEWSGRLEAWEGWQEVVAGNMGQEGSGGGSGGDVLKGTRDLEVRMWIEIDQLIRNLSRLQERALRLQQNGFSQRETGELRKAAPRSGMDMTPQVPVPSQMLGLLPPPPPGGWPGAFMLDKVADSLKGQVVGTHSKSEFVRVGPKYDPLRRANRLSYLAGSLLGIDQVTQAQALLEARGTQHRLAMLLKVITDINRQLALS